MSSPPSRIPLLPSQNPSNWRFTWEAQSHVPTLRLYLFEPQVKPSTQCRGLKSELLIGKSSLLVSFTLAGGDTSLKVPLPRALIDPESPVRIKAHDAHIEIKLSLLLPIDHALVSEFDSASSEDNRPLSADLDVKELSALEEVCFYCRNCSSKLSKSLSCFKELPSVNWQEAADNWFGNCCCSFGEISDKLVSRYAKSYTCGAGICLLDTAFVVLSKDDLLGCNFPVNDGDHVNGKFPVNNGDHVNGVNVEVVRDSALIPTSADDVLNHGQTALKNVDAKGCCLGLEDDDGRLEHEKIGNGVDCHRLSLKCSQLCVADDPPKLPDSHTDFKNNTGNCGSGCCGASFKGENSQTDSELQVHQTILLNGFISNGFLARSANISKEVNWVEFSCPQCSSVIGAYPSLSDDTPLDGGIRLFKCHISTFLPFGGSNDLFRHYSLERMFAIQLLERANDELSFRTVVRDMHTNLPMLQMVLLNPDSWCSSGYCLQPMESASRISMHPTLKVLFSACSNDDEGIESTKLEEWITKNQAEELYMLRSQIGELIASLESANRAFPPSQVVVEHLSLSSMRR